jgi:predicted Zn-dependent protease
VLALGPGCVKNPATGKRELSLVSQQQEVDLGQQAKGQVVQQFGLVENPALQSYVDGVGKKLAQASERPELPWSFQVVDDAAVNAFALPGGPIFVTRGILAHMGSEAELAAVLGHEVGHVTARHSAQQITRSQLAQAGLGLGVVLGSVLTGQDLSGLGQAAGLGAQMLLLKHGRDAERQADTLGLGYLVETRYQPAAMTALFEMLVRTSEGAERGKLPGWLLTHPEPQERLKDTQERLAKLPAPQEGVVERDAFLQRLDGMAYGPDPRQGFFRGQTFLHPGLRFQLSFPEGFTTQNQPSAVVGVSPRQDVAVMLQPTGAKSPEEAAQAFSQQQGLQVQAANRTTLNGLPAITAQFVAQTQQGVLEGVTAFVQHGGQVFQLLGLAPGGGMAAALPLVERSFQSFGPLTDAAALARQPATLRVVPLPRAMTLEEFARSTPSGVPLEELARINGVAPGQQLEAGRRVKRVEGEVARDTLGSAAAQQNQG